MGNYSDTLAEAAYAIAGHGFAEECGTVEETTGWNALVDVSPVTLLNVGETDLSERLRDYLDEIGREAGSHGSALVWVRQVTDGAITTVEWGHDGGTRSGTDRVSREWDRFVEAHDADGDSEEV